MGTEVEVPTLEGKASVKIPAGTQPNTVLRLKGKGFPAIRGFGKGDQHIRISVSLPKSLSSKEKQLIEQLEALHPHKKTGLDFVKKNR